MATFLEKLRERNKTRKDMTTPRVTNPKVPTKVEREVAVFAARQKPMPNFKFGTGTMLEKMKARMAERKDDGLTYADPQFHNRTNNGKYVNNSSSTMNKGELVAYEAKLESFIAKLKAKKAKKKQELVEDSVKQEEKT